MISYGDETVQFVEIDQPSCALTYSVTPCAAQLGVTGTRKCYNTRATCQDIANYAPTNTITLRFGFATAPALSMYGYVIPALQRVTITPLKINVGGMDRSISPFGQRETAQINFADFLHSDIIVDKYRDERLDGTADNDGAYDPYTFGTFWRKWMARNPFYEGYELRIYDGVVGQPISEMLVRNYIIDKISGPQKGSLTITAKDLFVRVEARKAVAPTANKGELLAAITDVAAAATLTPLGIGDLEYDAAGYIIIGEEAIAFTRVGDALTLTTRGALNTTAKAHDDEDRVQTILEFTPNLAPDIVYDLLTNYAGIDPYRIIKADWDAETVAHLPNLYSTFLTEPTPVNQLIAELAEQAGFTIWHDVTANLIRLKAIIPAGNQIQYTVNKNDWIKADSFSVSRAHQLRTSQVWTYYGQINPVKRLDERNNYRSRVIVADLTSESTDEYGTPSIREIFSRWIAQFGRSGAQAVGDRILSIFRDPPTRTVFSMHASRENTLQFAQFFRLQVDDITNDKGLEKTTTQIPVKLLRKNDTIHVETQEIRFFTPAVTERIIYIDDDVNDFDLRTIHDALFAPALSGDVVRCIIAVGVVVGGTTAINAAFDTGDWPAGVTLYLENLGTIAGKGGTGGRGGDTFFTGGAPDYNGHPGIDGELALKVQFAINIYNFGGTGIYAGGGGGGGGGSAIVAQGGVVPVAAWAGGGGGGGGAGRVSNKGLAHTGTPVAGFTHIVGDDGTDGVPLSLGTGGTGGIGTFGLASAVAGAGGDGGDNAAIGSPGIAGMIINPGTYTVAVGAGGAAGLAGAAIEGVASITWIDENDNPTTDMGTIIGATS